MNKLGLDLEAFKGSGIEKGFQREEIEKGKKVPVGTVTNGYKKIAEGKWVPVKKDGSGKSSKTSVGSTGKSVAAKMKNAMAGGQPVFSPSTIDKVSKMGSVTRADLEKIVPDYVSGSEITKLGVPDTKGSSKTEQKETSSTSTPKETSPGPSKSGSEIASKMKSSKNGGYSIFSQKDIDKVSKMDSVTEKDIDQMVSDSVPGTEISKLFK